MTLSLPWSSICVRTAPMPPGVAPAPAEASVAKMNILFFLGKASTGAWQRRLLSSRKASLASRGISPPFQLPSFVSSQVSLPLSKAYPFTMCRK